MKENSESYGAELQRYYVKFLSHNPLPSSSPFLLWENSNAFTLSFSSVPTRLSLFPLGELQRYYLKFPPHSRPFFLFLSLLEELQLCYFKFSLSRALGIEKKSKIR